MRKEKAIALAKALLDLNGGIKYILKDVTTNILSTSNIISQSQYK